MFEPHDTLLLKKTAFSRLAHYDRERGGTGSHLKTLRYGIEIETVGLNRERLARAIQTVTGGNVVNEGRGWRVTDATGRAWQVVPDGSLSGGEQSGEANGESGGEGDHRRDGGQGAEQPLAALLAPIALAIPFLTLSNYASEMLFSRRWSRQLAAAERSPALPAFSNAQMARVAMEGAAA